MSKTQLKAERSQRRTNEKAAAPDAVAEKPAINALVVWRFIAQWLRVFKV